MQILYFSLGSYNASLVFIIWMNNVCLKQSKFIYCFSQLELNWTVCNLKYNLQSHA